MKDLTHQLKGNVSKGRGPVCSPLLCQLMTGAGFRADPQEKFGEADRTVLDLKGLDKTQHSAYLDKIKFPN